MKEKKRKDSSKSERRRYYNANYRNKYKGS